MSKEFITIDDLTEMLSDIKKEQVEQIRMHPHLYPNMVMISRFEGMIDAIMYMFHFLNLETEKELHEIKKKIMDEINQEIRRMKVCQI